MLALALDIRFIDNGATAFIEKERNALVEEFANNIVEAISELMGSGTRSGKLYRKGKFDRRSRIGGQRPSGPGQRIHRSSAPGEALARETERTEKTISVRRLANGNVRIRFGGGIAFWEFKLPASLRRPTVMPAVELAAQRTFG